jgi:hypothetical protein
MMRRLALSLLATLGVSCAAGPRRLIAEDCRGQPGKVCQCSTVEEILDPDAALMDGSLFRALLAVMDYRNSKQRSALRATELDVKNFHVSVSRKPSPQVANAYAVTLTIKSAPGEDSPKLMGTSLGFGYTYFVDKKTFSVLDVRRHE